MTDTVLIQVPASPEFVGTVRAVTRSACALADLAADDVEELQIAVDEAATLLLPLVAPGGHGQLRARFAIGEATVGVSLAVECAPGSEIDRSGMAWILLTGLDPDVEVRNDGSEYSITIGRRRAGADL